MKPLLLSFAALTLFASQASATKFYFEYVDVCDSSNNNPGYWKELAPPSTTEMTEYKVIDNSTSGGELTLIGVNDDEAGPDSFYYDTWHYSVEYRTADPAPCGGFREIYFQVTPTYQEQADYWTLATDGFWNNTDSDATYHYVIGYYGTEGSGEPTSQVGATITVPANYNVQFTGLQHQNFSVHVYRDHAGGTAFVGQYYATLKHAPADELPAEVGVKGILTEGSTPPYIPENDFLPQWPESPEFVPADEREDQFGENYDENPVPNPEATDTDVVAAIDRHDNNRKEEHLTNENEWKISEENQNKRFEDLNEAQEDRQDEIVAWLAQNGAQNSAGHAATKNAIDELNSALTSGVEGAEDPGPVDVESYTDGQDDSLFNSMSEDIQNTVNSIMGLVPDPQTLPTVSGRNYTYSLSFASYKGADFSFDMDLNPYKSVIELIRALEAGLVVIMFLVSAIKTVRGGFA